MYMIANVEWSEIDHCHQILQIQRLEKMSKMHYSKRFRPKYYSLVCKNKAKYKYPHTVAQISLMKNKYPFVSGTILLFIIVGQKKEAWILISLH